MHLANVMQQIADRLATIAGLRAHGEPQGSVTPPAAIVSYPENYDFDATYGRGMDRLTLPVVLVIGRPTDRTTRDLVAAYCDGAGAKSIKAVIESGNDAGAYPAFDFVRVARIEFDVVTIGVIDYLAATFTLDIAGKGTP